MLVFHKQFLRFSEQSLKELLACRLWQLSEIEVSFYYSTVKRILLHTDKSAKGIITSNARLVSIGNSSTNPHQNLEKSPLHDINLE